MLVPCHATSRLPQCHLVIGLSAFQRRKTFLEASRIRCAILQVSGALTNLADTHEKNQTAIAAAGAVAPLVKLIKSGTPSAQAFATLDADLFCFCEFWIAEPCSLASMPSLRMIGHVAMARLSVPRPSSAAS